MARRIRPLFVDEDYFFAVLPRGATRVQIVARGVEFDAVMTASERFVDGLPDGEFGRVLFGACERGLSTRELMSEVEAEFRSMPPPSWSS